MVLYYGTMKLCLIIALIAQLDRASGYGPEGRVFESSSARQKIPFTKVGGIFYLFTINYSLFTRKRFVNENFLHYIR